MADNWTKNTIGEKNLLLSFVTFGLALHISCSMGLCVFDYKNISEKNVFPLFKQRSGNHSHVQGENKMISNLCYSKLAWLKMQKSTIENNHGNYVQENEFQYICRVFLMIFFKVL